MIDVQEIHRRIIELDVEHRDLDAVIDMLTATVIPINCSCAASKSASCS
jgi:hypothetical protein